MPPTIKLSVLDQSPIRSGATPADAIRETVELAQAADRFGYARYWLAEHHASSGLAGSAPEILVGRVAGATERIRVGSGGVMLSHYSPLKVAETFKLLETMYPGRIDLGIGRAPGSDGLTAAALAYGSQVGIEYFPARIADLQAFLTDSTPATPAFARVKATPRTDTVPELWLLGSSDGSAKLAAHFGAAFSFAYFINPYGGEAIMDMYRDEFQPSTELEKPAGSLCVFVVCADTEDRAAYLAKSRNLWRIQLEKGELGPYPTPEDAEAYPYSDSERLRIAERSATNIVGTPDQVKPQIEALADRFGVDEIMVLTITHDFAARIRSYELVAKAFDLAI
ncbi:MAG: LLM class flavin-dependent oxidoreductase [Proteobacteria bacterium]|nr:LLM class flavin-dependent oxidoreductase [Pseudomonadota bacterium]MDA1057712.1 LLM class flavin-dependent oxidoreductase [Pseudomonadota bacterium]